MAVFDRNSLEMNPMQALHRAQSSLRAVSFVYFGCGRDSAPVSNGSLRSCVVDLQGAHTVRKSRLRVFSANSNVKSSVL